MRPDLRQIPVCGHVPTPQNAVAENVLTHPFEKCVMHLVSYRRYRYDPVLSFVKGIPHFGVPVSSCPVFAAEREPLTRRTTTQSQEGPRSSTLVSTPTPSTLNSHEGQAATPPTPDTPPTKNRGRADNAESSEAVATSRGSSFFGVIDEFYDGAVEVWAASIKNLCHVVQFAPSSPNCFNCRGRANSVKIHYFQKLEEKLRLDDTSLGKMSRGVLPECDTRPVDKARGKVFFFTPSFSLPLFFFFRCCNVIVKSHHVLITFRCRCTGATFKANS